MCMQINCAFAFACACFLCFFIFPLPFLPTEKKNEHGNTGMHDRDCDIANFVKLCIYGLSFL